MNIFDWLGLLFVGLKLADKINWPWRWVLAPFWGQFVAGFLLGIWMSL